MVSRTKAADARLHDIMRTQYHKLRKDFAALQTRQHGRDYLVTPGTLFSDYAPRAAFITGDQLVELGRLYGLRPTGDRLVQVITMVYQNTEEFDKKLLPSLMFPNGDYSSAQIVLANVPTSRY